MKKIVFIILSLSITIHAEKSWKSPDGGVAIYIFNNNEQQTLNEIKKPSFIDENKKHLNNLNSWAIKNKLLVAGASITAIYLFMLYEINKTKNNLNSNNTWGSWKNNLKFEDLLAIPQRQLIKDLLSDIQNKYANKTNPADIISPIADFITNINNEYEKLELYIKFCKGLIQLNLNKLFSVSENDLYYAENQLKKLAYIKNIFNTWNLEYKRNTMTKWINLFPEDVIDVGY